MNADILKISELKWTGMGEFNSDDHYIYYCEQKPLEEMEQLSQSARESEMQYLDAISKMTECTPVLLPGKSHGRRSLVGCSPWGSEESDMTE